MKNFFLKDNAGNVLKIRPIEHNFYGDESVFLWVDLFYEYEKYHVCYYIDSYYNEWQWQDGDNEPFMSDELTEIFHSKQGDDILSSCLEELIY